MKNHQHFDLISQRGKDKKKKLTMFLFDLNDLMRKL